MHIVRSFTSDSCYVCVLWLCADGQCLSVFSVFTTGLLLSIVSPPLVSSSVQVSLLSLCLSVCMSMFMYILCVSVSVCACVCTCVCVCVCVCVLAFLYM